MSIWTASSTGKSLSEAPILALINPKYDDRLFTELRVQYAKTTSSVSIFCVHQIVLNVKTKNNSM